MIPAWVLFLYIAAEAYGYHRLLKRIEALEEAMKRKIELSRGRDICNELNCSEVELGHEFLSEYGISDKLNVITWRKKPDEKLQSR